MRAALMRPLLSMAPRTYGTFLEARDRLLSCLYMSIFGPTYEMTAASL